MGRNEYLERDGLFWESETHEWFYDKISTDYARKNSILWGSGEQRDALDVMCFIVRKKSTGDYERVMMDKPTNEVIYTTLSLEDMGYQIDKLKVLKRYK